MGPMAVDEFGEIDSFLNTLPDPAAALLFRTKLLELAGKPRERLAANRVLLYRVLLIQSYSPFLGEALLRNPELITWLEEQSGPKLDRVKTAEQMAEELARFSARTAGGNEIAAAAVFKIREMVRIYLRDCAGIATLSEITEELSNLADVILRFTLMLALTEEERLHGAPLTRDERGRTANAEMAVVALGKLGCRELNYASDVDLLFVYTGRGNTGDISNKDFFTRVAERLVRMAGTRHESSGGTPIYRTDLRLRPYGRDGDLVWEASRAAEYYRSKAQNWERQALIRARASAGSQAAFETFFEMVRGSIFRPDVLPGSMHDVRRAKEKIDRREAARPGGFNVKLGVGGIREIEFIAQALQLEHGGREPWVRSAQTLILLARLAEKRLLSESERARLSAAYSFLRTVEHRLQMEHGAQTHSLPATNERLTLLARKCGYIDSADPASEFQRDLKRHTLAVRSIFNSVLGEQREDRAAQRQSHEALEPGQEPDRFIRRAALALEKLGSQGQRPQMAFEDLTLTITEALKTTVNPVRSARGVAAWAESMESLAGSGEAGFELPNKSELPSLLRDLAVVSGSQYLSRIVVTPLALIEALTKAKSSFTISAPSFARELSAVLDPDATLAANADALRRAHHRLALRILLHDMRQAGTAFELGWEALRSSNLAQTALAEAVLQVASGMALSSIGVDELLLPELPFAVIGMGRLGHAGMDHGSDLDLMIVYDGGAPQQGVGARSSDELFTSFASSLIRILSAVTREGFLYSVDMRLRPEGKHGAVAQSLSGLLAYVQGRASAWEHSAYLKAREVAGHPAFGQRAKGLLLESVFDAASRNGSLREELAAMRNRLVKEKARGSRSNIKWGPGGMTDVYFITRYLQLRDRVYFEPEKGTTALIRRLNDCGSLNSEQGGALFEGYRFLRMLDHWMRLLLDRPLPEAPSSQTALTDLTRAMGFALVEDLGREMRDRMTRIEAVLCKILDIR